MNMCMDVETLGNKNFKFWNSGISCPIKMRLSVQLKQKCAFFI